MSPVNLKQLTSEIIDNFEEHWELKNSIREIVSLNEENTQEILALKSRQIDPRSTKGKMLSRKIALCLESIQAN